MIRNKTAQWDWVESEDGILAELLEHKHRVCWYVSGIGEDDVAYLVLMQNDGNISSHRIKSDSLLLYIDGFDYNKPDHGPMRPLEWVRLCSRHYPKKITGTIEKILGLDGGFVDWVFESYTPNA